jgi:hypothetical protein
MKELIRNIKNYAISSNKEIIYIDRVFNIISFSEKKCLGIIENACDIYNFENNIIVVEDYYGKAFIIDAHGIKPFLQNKYSISQIWENYAIVYWDNADSIGYFGIFNMRNNNLIYEKEDYMNRKILSSTELVCYNKTELFYINYIMNLTLWQFSIQDFPPYINGFFREQEADIKQIIGVYNNLLWIHVGGFRLVGIDINTGKMIHLIKDVLKGENGNNFLDIKNGTLKTLSYDYYAEFDLQTLQFRKQTTVKSEADIKIRASSFYEEDNYLYFCGYHNNKFDKPTAFGIFDTELAEIIWYDTTKDDSGYFYNPPQANDKLLAILDDKHNLLVYERNAI